MIRQLAQVARRCRLQVAQVVCLYALAPEHCRIVAAFVNGDIAYLV